MAATADNKSYKDYSGPANNGEAVTPSDTVNSTQIFRALWVGGAGNVSIQTVSDAALVFTSVPAGTILPMSGQRVNSTSTTATNIIAVW